MKLDTWLLLLEYHGSTCLSLDFGSTLSYSSRRCPNNPEHTMSYFLSEPRPPLRDGARVGTKPWPNFGSNIFYSLIWHIHSPVYSPDEQGQTMQLICLQKREMPCIWLHEFTYILTLLLPISISYIESLSITLATDCLYIHHDRLLDLC